MVLKGNTRHKKLPRKRRHDENETNYEKIARVAVAFRQEEEKNPKKFRPLLPIKDQSGALINQFQEEEELEEMEEEEATGEVSKEPQTVLQYTIEQRKVQIAKICSNIVNDPQNTIRELKKLQPMLWERQPRETCAAVRKLAMASMTCVFVDIIPGYRIRLRTEEEKAVKLSKDVRGLVDFEEALLNYYQAFLQSLEKVIKGSQKQAKNPILSDQDYSEITLLAVKSLCELYEKTPHFNYHNNIIMLLVPLMNSRNKNMSEMCCEAVRNLFRSDKSGEPTLATIKALCRMIKDQSGSRYGVRPEVLDTLLSLHINHVDFEAMRTGNKKKMNAKEKKKAGEEKKKLSRGQRKYLKRQQQLQSELKEAEATEKQETKMKYHTEIIQQVFLVYFRILKQKKGQGRPEKLLNSVLEGLAQFAHLINIDFFSDLIVVLQNLISSGELTHRQSLCCISTAFKVLSGQGEALNIDPTEFYKHLYVALFEIIHMSGDNLRRKRGDVEGRSSDLKMMMECLNIMLNKRRRQVTLSRLSAFIKRLSAMSLHLHPGSSASAALETMEKLLRSNSKTNALFDIESQEKSLYLPELDDPEHCGATSGCLWELHTLRRHFNYDVVKQADKMLRDASREQRQR